MLLFKYLCSSNNSPETHPLFFTYLDERLNTLLIDSDAALKTAINLETIWKRKVDPDCGTTKPCILELRVQLYTVVQQERAAAKEAAALAEAAAKAAAVKAAAAAAAVPVRRSIPLFGPAWSPPVAKVSKLDLEQQQHEAPQESAAAVHRGVRCDVCNTLPIVGIRYKCAVREVCTQGKQFFVTTTPLHCALLAVSSSYVTVHLHLSSPSSFARFC